MHILVTGGAGYIGSHTVVELLQNNYTITIVDNLSNSSAVAIDRIKTITGKECAFHKFDLQNKAKLAQLFKQEQFDAVIHFAGLKAVGESVKKPLEYYRNNIDASLALFEVMDEFNVRKLVFSSSATVYGTAKIPYAESSTVGQGITNPYGQTKFMIEQILTDTATAQPANQFALLRYFNPVGAHESGLIGEDPQGIPNNLMPFIAQVASKKRPQLAIFGNDYDTPDGTCVRDYIHVIDLAKGHLAALENLHQGVEAYNLGSGNGTSVLEMVKAFITATGQDVPYVFEKRRDGDLAEFYADPKKAEHKLGWKTQQSIEDMCKDTWNWQFKNSDGYDL